MSKLISLFGLYPKIFLTRRTLISRKALKSDSEVFTVGQRIQGKIKKLFNGSLSIREVDAGSTNACEQELTALSNTFYDIERFGIHFVASPRHADMLMVTGPVSRNMKEALIKTYEATPDPKIIVAVGDDAINGGIFKGSYAVLDGVDKVIPVNYYIPGDPPSPKIILNSLLKILEDRDSE
ncbi:MAG: NADH-quinone oxidoreductase subunit B family protein [bacterium]|nr:NADH-quinone oxidoreductase subunit B family protein [bacterium]